MFWNNFSLGVPVIIGGIFLPVAGVSGQCGEMLEKVCIGCHQSDKFCARLGASEKEWRGVLKLMVANGAELEKDEVAPLVACLSEPAAWAKAVCGR